jgi:hypothetical protein
MITATDFDVSASKIYETGNVNTLNRVLRSAVVTKAVFR